MSLTSPLIVALDLPNRAAALALLDRLPAEIEWYKVGLELYLAEGAAVVGELKARGKRVFLDLKLHDIPNTVASAVRVAAATGADLLTVHAAGGPTMLEAAVAAAGERTGILAVTVLTSMNLTELHAVGVAREPAQQVSLLAEMAVAAGVAGLVCSPQEVASLRAAVGARPLLVVPGIRSAGDAQDDQQRTASAAEALQAGASLLVIGRPITQSADPAAAAERFLAEIASAGE